MSAPERFSELSQPMQRALRRAVTGIPAAKPRSMGVQPRTLTALQQLGLVAERSTRKAGRQWRATERGRGLLATESQLFLHRRPHRPYTDDPAQAAKDAGEVVDTLTLAGFRRSAHQTEHDRVEHELALRRRLPVRDRLRLLELDAEHRGLPLDDDPVMRLFRRKLDELEQRVLRPADRFADAEPGE